MLLSMEFQIKSNPSNTKTVSLPGSCSVTTRFKPMYPFQKWFNNNAAIRGIQTDCCTLIVCCDRHEIYLVLFELIFSEMSPLIEMETVHISCVSVGIRLDRFHGLLE